MWALAVSHAASNFFTYFSRVLTYFRLLLRATLLPPTARRAVCGRYAHNSNARRPNHGALSLMCARDLSLSGAIVSGVAGRARTRSRIVRFLRSPTRGEYSRRRARGPAICCTLLALGGSSIAEERAEVLFVVALSLQSCSAAGFGCATQDISSKYASLIYGATSALAVVAGASGQYITGAILDANGECEHERARSLPR